MITTSQTLGWNERTMARRPSLFTTLSLLITGHAFSYTMLWKLQKNCALRNSFARLNAMNKFSDSHRSLSLIHSDDDDYYSLEKLQHRMKSFVDNHRGSCRICFAVAGGGGHFLSTLTSTPGASDVLLEGTITYDRESYRSYVQRDLETKFRFCSTESSHYLSLAALQRATRLAAAADPNYGHLPLVDMTKTVGIACTSELVTKATNAATSRAYITTTLPDTRQVRLSVQLHNASRTRWQEDILVSHCILTCLEYALAEEKAGTIQQENRQGDILELQLPGLRENNDPLRDAASRVLRNEEPCVLVVPTKSGWQVVPYTYLPPKSVIVPGSFNPPHFGHVELAKAALKATESNVAWFELSIVNADKPSLDVETVADRLSRFLLLKDLPQQWGVVLTNAALFSHKVSLLQPKQVTRGASSSEPLTFVVGTDTLVRILDPKYYDNDREKMLRTISSMPCHFVVGGRLDQKRSSPEFLTGEDFIPQLPADLQGMFTLLKDFRVDVSSTELRQKGANNG